MTKQSKKYVVLAIFALLIVVSVILFGSVKINYNISDYLDESTETKISLDIMESEFGTTGNIQVMVEDVSVEKAHEISGIIKTVPNVLLVNFNEEDENYYKDGDALFAVIVDGDEYSSTAAEVLDGIKAELDKLFEPALFLYSGRLNFFSLGCILDFLAFRNFRSQFAFIFLVLSHNFSPYLDSL